jgi:U3 small nucleolar RNA-associated protein 14
MEAKSQKATHQFQNRAVANNVNESKRRDIRGKEIIDKRTGNLVQLKYKAPIVKKSKHRRLQTEKKLEAGIGARREGPAPESLSESLNWVIGQMKHFHDNNLYRMLASEKM